MVFVQKDYFKYRRQGIVALTPNHLVLHTLWLKPHIFGYFVLGSVKSEAEKKTLMQQDVQINIRTSARNSVKDRQAGNVETAHVTFFSYTFIMPDYVSYVFLLLLPLPAF